MPLLAALAFAETQADRFPTLAEIRDLLAGTVVPLLQKMPWWVRSQGTIRRMKVLGICCSHCQLSIPSVAYQSGVMSACRRCRADRWHLVVDCVPVDDEQIVGRRSAACWL